MTKYFRRVMRIRAVDSPNVKFAEREKALGMVISHTEIIPGVLSYSEYTARRATWDKIRQCVGLDAEFYKGAEILLFPPEWLNNAEELASKYERERRGRTAKAVGVDPAEGGDKTAMVAIDELGVIACESRPTPDTDCIPREVLAFCNKHGLKDWVNLVFDRGGGGKQHADRLRAQGYKGVRTVAFGESLVGEVDDARLKYKADKIDKRESAYEYKNRRAQLYGELSEQLDPSLMSGFSLHAKFTAIRHQLSPIPKGYDPEGRLILPPKNKKNPDSKEMTLVELIGQSPDEADALVLALHVMLHKPKKRIAKGY